MQREELKIKFPSESPVAGFQFVPVVTGAGAKELPDDSLTFEWYRLEKVEKGCCSIHPSKSATFQCTCCVRLNVPVQFSYHCSLKCFYESWSLHREKHEEAIKTNYGIANLDKKLKDDLKSTDSFWSAFRHQQSLLPSSFSPEEAQQDKNEQLWRKIGSSKTYTPEVEDVGCILRLICTPVNSDPGTPLYPPAVAYTFPVLPSSKPQFRQMVQIGPIEAQNDSGHETFSVLSYNILSDLYATADVHGNCPPWALAWEYRRQNLIREIVGYKADILCLQEVQSDHFENFFAPELAKHGYSALYKRKTYPVFTRGEYVSDGCAIFFLHERFKVVKKFEIEFDKAPQRFTEIVGRKVDLSHYRRLIKDNIALIAVLATKNRTGSDSSKSQTGYSICVANTHIHANQKLSDVKLLQVYILLSELEKRINSDNIPILLCADLNSLPRSAVYDLLVTGKVDSSHPEVKVDPTGIFQNLTLSHTLPLVSAYSTVMREARGSGPSVEDLRNSIDSATREPKFTNFTCNFVGTLDYIFFTGDTLMLKSLLELPSSRTYINSPLPSPEWSSDHLALMASFRVCQRNWGSQRTPVPTYLQKLISSAPRSNR